MNFEIGKTYWTRYPGTHHLKLYITIARRTAKTLLTTEGKTLRVSTWQGCEQVKPEGNFSLCPVLSADSEVAE